MRQGDSDATRVMIDRPLLVYDGNCGFCRRQVGRWRDLTGDRVEYATAAEVQPRYPQVTPEMVRAGVVLLTTAGETITGAEAVLSALGGWKLWAYRRVPGVRAVADFVYALVARHRHGASALTGLLSGPDPGPSTCAIASWIFLRLLGVTFLIAFVSLWTQVHGLVGDDGILPAHDYLVWARDSLGTACYRTLPTVCWLSTDGAFLNVLCGTGVMAALLLTVGIVPIPALGILWLLYLSLCVIGQTFLSFQWDTLLLETALIAAFLAPVDWRPKLWSVPRPSPIGLLLGRLLLFKLMFLSGVTKLLSGEPTWRDLSALDLHYETQPLPSWIGWYAHQLPEWFQRLSVANMYVIEIALPFLFFAPRRVRHVAAAGVILLQVLIAATGSYCFFNLLAVALCVLLLDDQLLRRMLPRVVRDRITVGPRNIAVTSRQKITRYALNTAGGVVLLISACVLLREAGQSRLVGGTALLSITDPLRTINGYGLFRIMTTERFEIVIEGSDDGMTWSEYEFRWKPGDLARRPRFAAPHQPRLDWQMWFAGANPERNAYWLRHLANRLLEGSKPVLDLLADNPFPDQPPRYVRFIYYRYEFTDPSTKRRTGHWWARELRGTLTPPIAR